MNQIHIITERLFIRNLTDDDKNAYFKIFGNPNIAKYDDFEPISAVDANNNIYEITNNYINGSKEHEYAVELMETKTTIGVLYMNEEETRTLIGYHFNEDYHGKGYAIEAVESFISWIKTNSDKKIEALVDYKNLPSIKLLKKLGFEQRMQDADELLFELLDDNH